MSAIVHLRAYVVGFGDCVLLAIPDGGKTRRVLIDFGRAPNDAESLERFPGIAKNISAECGGHLDLLVVTHEHLDHMEGFYRERAVFNQMQIDQVWMGLPSHPDYYKNYRNARPQKKLQAALAGFARTAARRGLVLHPAFQGLLENNLANKDRIDYLRKLGVKPVAYLARGKSRAATQWSKNIKVRVLAPEPDTSVYYSKSAAARAQGAAFTATNFPSPIALSAAGFQWDFKSVARAGDAEHPGFSASDLQRLRRAVREDGVAAARFIDRAQNNSSLCLLIEVGGKRLLLPGDAELESWEMMHMKCATYFKPINFLKVAHHGSHNGTPRDGILDALLPTKNKKNAQVLVSTKRNIYGTKNPVPDASLLEELRRRCSRLVTTDGATGTYVDMKI